MPRLHANERKFPKRRKELLGTKTKAAKTEKCRTWRILISLSASISFIVALIEYEKETIKTLKKKNTYSTQGKQHHFILQLLRILIILVLYIWKFI